MSINTRGSSACGGKLEIQKEESQIKEIELVDTRNVNIWIENSKD